VTADEREAPRPGALVFALVAPAVAWAVQLGASYSLTTPVCEADARWVLHAIGASALALAAGGGWMGLREWRSGGAPEGGAYRFLVLAAMAWAALLSLAIVAAWIPAVLARCT
jgi:hypothetical protein